MKNKTKTAIQRSKAGDMVAFAELFESLRPIVFAIAYRLVGGNDADDVVMETYLKAWKAIPKYNEKGSLKTWLYRITYNTAMDFLRAKGRLQNKFVPESSLENRTLDDFVDENKVNPAATLAKADMNIMVRRALSLLDKDHRTVIWLRFADETKFIKKSQRQLEFI